MLKHGGRCRGSGPSQPIAARLLAVVIAALLLAGLWSWQSLPVRGQEGGDDPLDDPVVRGAWLYEGNCTGCHGAYAQGRIGNYLYPDEGALLEAIEGGSGGCRIDWSYKYDGPFRSRDLKALVAFMMAWEELDGPPDLPELPAQPTPTPKPSPTPLPEDQPPTPTPTPTPQIDPQVLIAIGGSELAHGAWLYTQNCHRCHLAYAKGRMGSSISEDTVENAIKKGKVGTSMPAFSRREGGDLRASEINAIRGYIAAWELLEAEPALPAILFTPPTPDPADFQMIRLPDVPPVAGDPGNGARLFLRHCADCHGLKGEGGAGARLAKEWPAVRPDLTIRSAIAQGIPGSAMPAWSRKQGGELTDGELDDLTTFVLALDPVEPPRLMVTAGGLRPMNLLLLGLIPMAGGVAAWGLSRLRR